MTCCPATIPGCTRGSPRRSQADPGLVPPGRAVIEQAHHWYAAHDTVGALVSSWRAAAAAGRALAHAEQLTLLARVLELWDKVPDAEQRIGASHLSVLEHAAAVARTAGENERGRRVRLRRAGRGRPGRRAGPRGPAAGGAGAAAQAQRPRATCTRTCRRRWTSCRPGSRTPRGRRCCSPWPSTPGHRTGRRRPRPSTRP